MNGAVDRSSYSGAGELDPSEESGRTESLESYRDSLRWVLEDYASRYRIPGMCLEISSGGERLGAAVGTTGVITRRPMTRDTRFELGIIGTALISLGVLELSNAGVVDVHTPLSTYLPELVGASIGDEVTVSHLLSHSGGHRCVDFADERVRKAYSWSQCVSDLRDGPPLFTPGSVFSFSPIATVLLREIIRRVTGRPAMEVLKAQLLNPLSIRTGVVREDTQAACAGYHEFDSRTRQWQPITPLALNEFWCASPSELTMSIADLVTVYDAILAGRAGGGGSQSVISRQSALALQERVIQLPVVSGGPQSEQLPLSCGLGCAEYHPNWHGNNGPVFGQTVLIRYHRTHRAVLAIGASANVPVVCEAILNSIEQSLGSEDPVPQAQPDCTRLEPSELVGTYRSPAGRAAIVEKGRANTLICELRDSRGTVVGKLSLEMMPTGRWVARSDPGRWPIGIFREPVHSDPCLMIGLCAYKKVRSSVAA